MRGWSYLTSLPLNLVLISVTFSIWLVPACLVIRWIMARRKQHGVWKALVFGLAASILVCGALFGLPLTLVQSSPERATLIAWDRLAGAGATCSIFLLVWLACFEILAKKAVTETAPEAGHGLSVRARAVRTLIEALPVGASFLWISIVGLVAGAFVSDGGIYRPAFTVDSPEGGTRAHVVEYLRPGGGCRSGVDQEIYLLPSSETWSPVHRGLLVWKGNNLWRGSRSRSLVVEWETERLLSVGAPYDTTQSGIDRREAFARDGFTARTVTVP